MSWDIGREQWDRDPDLIKEQEAYKVRTGCGFGVSQVFENLQIENAQLKESNQEAIKILRDILWRIELPPTIEDDIRRFIAKAEREGE
jgi:hypothetical protein